MSCQMNVGQNGRWREMLLDCASNSSTEKKQPLEVVLQSIASMFSYRRC